MLLRFDFPLNLPTNFRGRLNGPGEAQVEIGLVDAGLLHHLGKAVQDGHDAVRDLGVAPMPPPYEDRRRQAPAPGRLRGLPGLGDGLRRMNAVFSGRIVGGGHHPPPLAARRVGPHHQGFAAQFRLVPLFHGGKKGVHVQVADEAHDFPF